MPVKFSALKTAGNIPTLNEVLPWLGAQRQPTTPADKAALECFLDYCNIKYSSSEADKDKFVTDWRVMMTPAVTDVVEAYITSVGQARDYYLTKVFNDKLEELKRMEEDGTLKIRFASSEMSPADINQSKTISLGEKYVGISRSGMQSMYTGGFSGCTGVVIAPVAKAMKGGILAHISQMGTGEDVGGFLTMAINEILHVAKQKCDWVSSKIDVALLIGGVQGNEISNSRIEVPDLADRVRKECTNGDIENVYDLRPFRDRAGQFFFNSEAKILHLLKSPPKNSDTMLENFFNLKEPVPIKFNNQDIGRLVCYFLE